MPEDDVRTELEKLGKRRQEAVAQQEEVSAELRAVILRALDNGVPVGEIARLAQVTRQAIWKMRH